VFRLVHMGHVSSENRYGLVIDAQVTMASPKVEETGLEMMQGLEGQWRKTVGADKAYDEQDFVEGARAMTPHVSQHTQRASHIDCAALRYETKSPRPAPGALP